MNFQVLLLSVTNLAKMLLMLPRKVVNFSPKKGKKTEVYTFAILLKAVDCTEPHTILHPVLARFGVFPGVGRLTITQK